LLKSESSDLRGPLRSSPAHSVFLVVTSIVLTVLLVYIVGPHQGNFMLLGPYQPKINSWEIKKLMVAMVTWLLLSFSRTQVLAPFRPSNIKSPHKISLVWPCQPSCFFK
jgi:hypothetical protein